MDSTVGDPVLLTLGRRTVDDKLLGGRVVTSGRLHLDGIVTVAQLGQTEAAGRVERVDIRNKVAMTISAQFQYRATKLDA